jgi:uncharacterized protein (DUF362 family)
MVDFFINIQKDSAYPSPENFYNPDYFYPEYIWSNKDISKEKNDIYRMVRDCLIGLKLDIENLNTKLWNPFGDFINSGDTVLIKPNWVMHRNENKTVIENSLECLVTHPSVVKAVIDYCLIALKGTGRVIIGDAPMQGCELDRLIESSGYKNLFDFYSIHNENLYPTDFRHYSTTVDKNKILVGKKHNENDFLEVILDKESRLIMPDHENRQYIVSDYSKKTTNQYHHDEKHSYLINKEVLSADVIVNLCKPKCHRLAGLTAGMKNFVGIIYDKACLPHRTEGSKQQGGDEYLNNSIIKKLIGIVLNSKINYEEWKMFRLAFVMRYSYGFLYYIMKYLSRDPYIIGSWYGNDTIWRTVLDLNYCLLFADKNGIIQNKNQRKIFNIADMIISGEGNGPISPEPKKLGIIIAGYETSILDRLVCELMGFDYEKVPSVCNALADERLTTKPTESYVFDSNLSEYKNKRLDDLKFPLAWQFKPYDSWKGFIEKE